MTGNGPVTVQNPDSENLTPPVLTSGAFMSTIAHDAGPSDADPLSISLSTINAAVAPLSFRAGDQHLVLLLPFGSYFPDQPVISITINVAIGRYADVSTPLPIEAVGGFEFGATSQPNDFATFPTISPFDTAANTTGSPTLVPSYGNFATTTITPAVFTVTKSYSPVPGGGTATGPDSCSIARFRSTLPPARRLTPQLRLPTPFQTTCNS